ncbi:MAG: HAMP domain-containing sensor histidine kinase [Clostridia bacterium]|nr:HAMP domain-containing sensor histidine kinase [Clostridia bacterium]
MIKKLRARFIALSMFSLALVLVVIMGAINLISYRDMLSDADGILDVLAQNDGKFPKSQSRSKATRSKPFISPETPYESRYFSVLLSQDGEAVLSDTGRIAAVDTSTAMQYAQTVWASGDERGFIENYRYVLIEYGESQHMAIFLDCGKSLSTFRAFLFTCCSISLFGILAVFMLLAFLSGRIIKPVIESYERQKQFITDAGHEIKTPITIIDADCELLAMEIEENQWLADIQFQNNRLASLTNDLITLSRMEEDNAAQFKMIDFPFSDIVSEMAQSFQGLAASHGRRFASDIRDMITLRGDEKAIRQLVSILLDNAVKYCPPSGEIRLSLDRQGSNIRLSVQNDIETDIPASQLDRLFDRFYRADPSRNSQTGGSGIGLSIARAIVVAHKGKISACIPKPGRILMTATFPAKNK